MIFPIQAKEWESKSALLAHMDDAEGKMAVLGNDAEAPRKFYSFSIALDHGVSEVGVISSGLGTKPQVALLQGGRRAIVGYDTWMTWLDMKNKTAISSRRLNGVFYEFLRIGHENEILVVHELGVARVAADGSEVWSVHTGVVEQASFDGQGNLILAIMDEPTRIVVSLETGRDSHIT